MANRIILAILVLLLAVPALAVPVDSNAPDGIAAWYFNDSSVFVLTTTGSMWVGSSHEGTWAEVPQDFPVPVSQMAEGDVWYFRTHDGTLYRSGDTGYSPNWAVMPSPPIGPIPEQKSSLGGVKGQYR